MMMMNDDDGGGDDDGDDDGGVNVMIVPFKMKYLRLQSFSHELCLVIHP